MTLLALGAEGQVSEVPHLACAVVADAGVDLVLGIHHKRPVAHERFIERMAAENQEFGILERVKTHHVATPIVQGELLVTQQGSAFALELALEDVGKGGVGGVDGKVEAASFRQGDVEVEGGREGEHRGGASVQGSDHHLDLGVVEFEDRGVFAVVDDRGWIAEFFRGWGVEPNLKAMHSAAVAADFVARDLLVDGATSRAEEHEFALAVHDVVGEAVGVTATARDEVRRGGDASVGVGLDVHAQGAGFNPHGPKLIQHHPRRDQIGVVASKGSND